MGELDEALRGGNVQFIIGRLGTKSTTCAADDVPPRIGGPQCQVVGETFASFSLGRWRGSSGAVPVQQVVDQLRLLFSSVRGDLSDKYGTGTLRVYAVNAQDDRRDVIITAIITAPPGFGGANTIRVALSLTVHSVASDWKVAGIVNDYVLPWEFLDPHPDVKAGLFPNWERYDKP